MANIIKFESISQVHEMIGYEKPRHPLISLIETPEIKIDIPVIGQHFTMDFYVISLKNGHECRIKYGRQRYDFQEGSLLFMAPDQIIEPVTESDTALEEPDPSGWVLIFHPDLLRRTSLGKKMNEYTFFSYDSHEALHVSDQERQTVTSIAQAIRNEYRNNLDNHSHELIVTNLELMLNYCKRFYGRQFITRSNENKDVIVRLEDYLKSCFDADGPLSRGLPSVKDCAREMGYSPNYLSDLLKKETGKNTQEHIHCHLIEKAKNLLLGTEEPVYRIAYALGFDYPQHFSKLFKNKTGMSPAAYRN